MKNLINQALHVYFGGRGRDSNPRVVSDKLISSQPCYDHFDTFRILHFHRNCFSAMPAVCPISAYGPCLAPFSWALWKTPSGSWSIPVPVRPRPRRPCGWKRPPWTRQSPSLRPPAFRSDVPIYSVLIRARMIAPAHIVQGSSVTYRSRSVNLQLPSSLQARRMVVISAWSVESLFNSFSLWPRAISCHPWPPLLQLVLQLFPGLLRLFQSLGHIAFMREKPADHPVLRHVKTSAWTE